jgi:hypothetical protein
MHWKIKILVSKTLCKNFFSSNMLFPRFVPPYAILGFELLEETTLEDNKHPFIVTHSQLLKGPKCGSKWNTTEGGVGARSLAHNTLRGRGACWSFGMGLGRVDKLHSLTRACTQSTQSG